MKFIQKQRPLDTFERNQLKKVATAWELGIDKNTLRRKIKRFGILEPR